MAVLNHFAAHEIARDLGCLMASTELARSTSPLGARRSATHAGSGPWIVGVARALARWTLYRRTLRDLRRLSARQLADIGLDRAQLREVSAAVVERRLRESRLKV